MPAWLELEEQLSPVRGSLIGLRVESVCRVSRLDSIMKGVRGAIFRAGVGKEYQEVRWL